VMAEVLDGPATASSARRARTAGRVCASPRGALRTATARLSRRSADVSRNLTFPG